MMALAAVVLIGSLTVLSVAIVVTPEAIEAGRFSLGGPCPYRARHGKGCYGCGMTRGLAAAGSGRWALAYRYHPAAPLLLVGIGVVAGASLSALIAGACRVSRARPGPARRWVSGDRSSPESSLSVVALDGIR